MEVPSIFETKAYELTDEEKAQVIKNWLVREGLQLIKTFTNEEKEKCKTAKGLISMLCHELNLHYNRIAVSLQYLKLKRKIHKSAQEWMDRLQAKAADYDCNESDRRLPE